MNIHFHISFSITAHTHCLFSFYVQIHLILLPHEKKNQDAFRGHDCDFFFFAFSSDAMNIEMLKTK